MYCPFPIVFPVKNHVLIKVIQPWLLPWGQNLPLPTTRIILTPWMVCISSREPISLFACYTLLCSSSCLESYSSFPFPDFPGSLEHLSPPLVLSLKVTFVVLPALTVYTGPPLSHSNHSSGLFLAQILSLLIVIYLVICVLALLIFPSHSYQIINSMMTGTRPLCL